MLLNDHDRELLRQVSQLKKWIYTALPVGGSFVAFDILLLMAQPDSHRITVKEFFSSLPHSYTAVRQHYTRLIEGGWLTHFDHPTDKRIKYISVTEKYEILMKEYASRISLVGLKN
jgi:DNA-binding MarR family transcriptional regulator